METHTLQIVVFDAAIPKWRSAVEEAGARFQIISKSESIAEASYVHITGTVYQILSVGMNLNSKFTTPTFSSNDSTYKSTGNVISFPWPHNDLEVIIENDSDKAIVFDPMQLISRLEFRAIEFAAYYAYRKANPTSDMNVPSIVYEDAERSYKEWSNTNPL